MHDLLNKHKSFHFVMNKIFILSPQIKRKMVNVLDSELLTISC